MSSKKKCDRLFYEVVHARDGHCQNCGVPGGEAHRIILKSQVPPAWLRYDPDFAVILCPAGHRGDARGGCDKRMAPHISPLLFKAITLPRLLNGMDPARAAKIRTYTDHVWRSSRERPDYKEIAVKLAKQLAEVEGSYEPESLRMHYG